MSPAIPYFTPIEIPITDTFSLSGFGLFFGLGLLLGNLATLAHARRGSLRANEVWNGLAVVNIATIFGASLAYRLVYEPSQLTNDWKSLIDFRTGLSSVGGVVISIVGCLFLFRKDLARFWCFADSVGFGFLVGIPVARLGCVLNHEHLAGASQFFLARYCRPVDGHTIFWPASMSPQLYDYRFGECLLTDPPVFHLSGIVKESFPGVIAVHDLAIYEILLVIAIGIVVVVASRFIVRSTGEFFILIASSYAIGRFAIEFLRPELFNPRYFGLTGMQWGLLLSLCLIFVAIPARRRIRLAIP